VTARDPAQIEREIEETREELAESVGALAEKTDVKGRAEAKVEETKDAVAGQIERAKSNPIPLAIGGVIALAILSFWLIRRRSS
jgi:hypothetical protein